MADIIMMTVPLPDEYRCIKNFGLVTGVTCRTRGIGGNFVAGIESMAGGEVTAYTSEMEKARFQAIDRLKEKAVNLGANAIVGVDVETANVLQGVIVISATGTALLVEKTK